MGVYENVSIDAISCLAIHPDILCISTAGVCTDPPWLETLMSRKRDVACGFDSDDVGNRMAARMSKKHPAIQRVRPTLHDWNDDLTKRM